MRRGAVVLLLAVTVTGCGSSRSSVRRMDDRTVIAGGCGATTLYRGTPPAWTGPAFSDSSNPPAPMSYGLAEDGDAVAVVFGYPLRAGHPTNPANKILWIMRLPRRGSPLRIEAHPLHRESPRVTAA